MLWLEARGEPSRLMTAVTPFLAVVLTMLSGLVLFSLLGKDPVRAMGLIFVAPLTSLVGLAELTVKATPLILIATGLAIGFRAGVWNIGAEGQFAVGALAGSAVALQAYPGGGPWLLPLMCLAGVLGGMAWAAIPALLKTRFQTNEILVSLMLVYVALLLLAIMVQGPLRDPTSFNFPESRLFQRDALLPGLYAGTRAHVGFLAALGIAVCAYAFVTRHIVAFQLKVLGEAPAAARFAGYSPTRLTWFCFLLSGGLAGLAGLFEAAGPVGQLVPGLPSGYGFTGIIVAFLGRLHPIGVLGAALLLALTQIGGETARVAMSLPSATTAVFQALLLFYLLAMDVLLTHRMRWGRTTATGAVARRAMAHTGATHDQR
jgi:general nucleoside transport system permease protein